MTTQSAPQNRLSTEQIREAAKVDLSKALDMAIAETERVRSQAAIAEIEFKEMSELTFGPGGMQASTAAALWRLSGIFSRSDLVPEQFRNKRENCFIGIQMAFRCRVDPFAFLQKCYIVHGRPGIESQLAIAMANGSGLLDGRIKFDITGDGDNRKCRAHAKIKDGGDIIESIVSVKIAKDMGWWGKAQSLWPKMTDLMLQYRSAMWLIRTNLPEVIMGLMSKEELKDGAEIDEQTTAGPSLEDRIKAFESRANGNGHSKSEEPPAPEPQDVHIEPSSVEDATEDFPPRDEPARPLDEGLRKGNAIAEIKSQLKEAFGDDSTAISKTIATVFKVKSLATVERWAADQVEVGLAQLKAHLDTLPNDE